MASTSELGSVREEVLHLTCACNTAVLAQCSVQVHTHYFCALCIVCRSEAGGYKASSDD